MFEILSVIPGRKKVTGNGWHSFNAVCCHHRGHKPDKRSRGGIKFESQYNWRYHCFNCGFTCGFSLGQTLSKKVRQVLTWCGIDDEQITQWNLESLRNRDLVEALTGGNKPIRISFPEASLPEGARMITPEDTQFVDYLASRNIDYRNYPYMITPDDKMTRNRNRVIIPFTYHGKIVGNTSRYCDNKSPKYINDQPPGYVFGLDLQKPEWQVCILVEGIFDALSIMGCAYMHNTISKEQAQVLAGLNRRIIVVPDQDKTGLAVTDRALELGYSVSIPKWENCKDVNEAVVKYGALATTLSIIECATTSPIVVKMRKQELKI